MPAACKPGLFLWHPWMRESNRAGALSDAVDCQRRPTTLPPLVPGFGTLVRVVHWHGCGKARRQRDECQHIENPEPLSFAQRLCSEVHAAVPTDQEVRAARSKAIALQRIRKGAGEQQGSC